MAILHASADADVIPAADAAHLLGLSRQRVRALVADGELPGQKLAGRWFVDRAAVERRLRDARLAGRPYSAAHAWGLIALAEGERADWLRAPERSRLRARLRSHDMESLAPSLRRRARRIDLRAHASDLPRIEAEADVVRSGVSAASDHRLEIVAPGVIDAYVPARRLSELERQYHLRPSRDPNVIFRVIDGPWPFAPDQRVAPRVAAVLDLLEDDDARTRAAARRALIRDATPRA